MACRLHVSPSETARSLSPEVVDLDEANADAAILARKDGGELSRGQQGINAGLFRIRKPKPIGGQLRGRVRIILPIVVGHEEGARTVAQFESRIGQRRIETELSER